MAKCTDHFENFVGFHNIGHSKLHQRLIQLSEFTAHHAWHKSHLEDEGSVEEEHVVGVGVEGGAQCVGGVESGLSSGLKSGVWEQQILSVAVLHDKNDEVERSICEKKCSGVSIKRKASN